MVNCTGIIQVQISCKSRNNNNIVLFTMPVSSNFYYSTWHWPFRDLEVITFRWCHITCEEVECPALVSMRGQVAQSLQQLGYGLCEWRTWISSLFCAVSMPAVESTHTPTQWVTWSNYVNMPGLDVNSSLLLSAEGEKDFSCTSTKMPRAIFV
jgi:hypothetical protein